MSHLINNELIWIAIPKCASCSIESALLNSNLEIKKFINYTHVGHVHIPLTECISKFGNKETICITRDWFSKWLSSLNFIWDVIEFRTDFTPIQKWEEIDNDFIYNIFNTEFLNNLHYTTETGYKKCFSMLLKNKEEDVSNVPYNIISTIVTLISEKYYKSNQKCTYEFDIKEIDKFIDFIENRFGEKLFIENINTSTKRPNKIIVNDELKNFIWNAIEKRYEKINKII